MALTKEQLNTINTANEKFKTLKDYCKEHNIELNALLSSEQKKQMKEGITFLKTFVPKVKKAELAAQVSMDEEDVIPKGVFLKTVKARLDSLITSSGMELIRDDLNRYSLDLSLFTQLINKIPLKTPFAKELREKILSKSTHTVESIARAVNRVVGEYQNKNGKLLKEHYSSSEEGSNYKEFYKQEEVIIADLISDLDNLTGLLDDCIIESIDDPNYPPNKEKAAKLAKELEKKQKELEDEIDEFKQVYADWVVEQEKICSGIISTDTKTDSIFNVSKKIFLAMLIEKSNVWSKAQPELTEELRSFIAAAINKEDSSTIRNFVLAMSQSLNDIKTPKDVLFKNWKEAPDMPSFYGLKTAIIAITSGTSQYDLSGEYMEWAASVGGVLDSLKVSESQQFVTEKLLKGFQELFNKPEVEFFYPVFEQKLQAIQKAYPTTKEVSRVWQTTLYDVIVKGDAMNDQFELIEEGKKKAFITNLSKRLTTITGEDTIKKVFERCKRPVLKKKALANGVPLALSLTLNDGTILTNTLSTKIIRINGKRVCVVPENVVLSASSGEWGYSFKESNFFAQSPIEKDEEMVVTYFQFKVEFSKGRGSIAKGTETSSEYGTEGGWEKSVNEVEMRNWNNSAHGETTVSSGKLAKLFVDGEVTGGYAREWGGESGTETTNGTFGSLSYSRGSANSTEVTTDKGNDTGFILIKGSLLSYAYDEVGTVKVDLDVQKKDLSSPNPKGFAPVNLQMTKKKEIKWEK